MSATTVVLGWRVVNTDTRGRIVPVTPRLFTIRAAADEYMRLARASGVDAYVHEITGIEPPNDGIARRRTGGNHV
jgi:hypothetical protein